MSLPDLCIAPHEARDLAPAQPLCAPADWRVKTQWGGDYYLVRAVEFQFDEREVVAHNQHRGDAPLLRLNISKLAADENLIVNDIRRGQFERRLAFDSGGSLVVAPGEAEAILRISCFGETLWTSLQDEQIRFVWQGEAPKFRFGEKWRRLTTDAQIERDIGQMLADDASDCAFAWTWLHGSARQREQSLYRIGCGSLDEVETLLRAICVNGARELIGAGWRLSLNLGVGVGAATEFYAGGTTEMARGSYLKNDDDTRPLAPSQVRLVELVLRHFELWRNWRAQTYTVIQELWKASGYWLIPFAAPSMHEVLEARLLLRDFLRDKVSPDEVRELLGEA